MKKLKFGVVGVNSRGRGVLGQVIGESDIELKAVCDIKPEELAKAKDYFENEKGVKNLECYSDYDEMLKKADIDAVFVATYAIDHVSFVIKALEAGKHVLSEIPAVNSIDEAKQLKAAVLAHPELKYMVAENCCYWGFIQAWKIMADEGKFGEAVYAESEYLHSCDYRDLKPENFPPEHWRSFNPSIKYLTHNLGPLLHILDDECVSVTAMEPDVVYNPYVKIKKNAVALFKTKKGAMIRILISFGSFTGFDHNFRILGTRGSIMTDPTKKLEDAHSFASFSDIPGSMDDKVEIPVTMTSFGKGGSHGGADRKMILDFVNCVLNDTPVPLDVDFAIRISLPGVIAAESIAKGGMTLEIPKI